MTANDNRVFNSEQVNDYLKRLGISISTPDLSLLKRIHKAHLSSVPIENLDLFFGHQPRFDVLLFYQKIVSGARGGTAIELNLLLYSLLKSLDYNCWLGTATNRKNLVGIPIFEHPLVLIEINSQIWLADVGSVGLFIEPKQILPEVVQLDYNQYFRFVTDPDGNCILQKSHDGTVFESIYLFSKAPVRVIQFLERYEYHQNSTDSPLRQQKFISKALDHGQVLLTERTLTCINNGNKEETPLLHEDDFAAKLEQYFGINYVELLHQRISQ